MKTINAYLCVVPNTAIRFDGCGNGPLDLSMRSYELTPLVKWEEECYRHGICKFNETNISTRWIHTWIKSDHTNDATMMGWAPEDGISGTAPEHVPEEFVRKLLAGEVTTKAIQFKGTVEDCVEIHWHLWEDNKYCFQGSIAYILERACNDCDSYGDPVVIAARDAYLTALKKRAEKRMSNMRK